MPMNRLNFINHCQFWFNKLAERKVYSTPLNRGDWNMPEKNEK